MPRLVNKPFVVKDSENYRYNIIKLTEDENEELDKCITEYKELLKSPTKNKEILDKIKISFYADYRVNLGNELAIGLVSTIPHFVLREFVTYDYITDPDSRQISKKDADNNKQWTDIKSYKCFAGKDGIKANVVIHQDYGSAWNCLMGVLGNPNYVIIYKEEKEK